jgi:hypothetical protein
MFSHTTHDGDKHGGAPRSPYGDYTDAVRRAKASDVLVANGTVRVGDWVRELPAQHFQPCYCCLCRPSGGERPSFQVEAIGSRKGVPFLRLSEIGEVPAEECERVGPPAKRRTSGTDLPMGRDALRAFLQYGQ